MEGQGTSHRAGPTPIARAPGAPALSVVPKTVGDAPPSTTPLESLRCYLTVNGQQFGPMTLADVQSWVRRGGGRGSDGSIASLWYEGLDQWVPLNTVKELRAFVPPLPPSAPRRPQMSLDEGDPQRVAHGSAGASSQVGQATARAGDPAPATPKAAPVTSRSSRVRLVLYVGGAVWLIVGALSIAGAMGLFSRHRVQTETPKKINLAALAVSPAEGTPQTREQEGVPQDRSEPTRQARAREARRSAARIAATLRANSLARERIPRANLPDMANHRISTTDPVERHRLSPRGDHESTTPISAKNAEILDAVPVAGVDDLRRREGNERGRWEHMRGVRERHLGIRATEARRTFRRREITPEEIVSLQRRYQQNFQRCYERAVKRDLELREVSVDVSLTIGASGVVRGVSFEGTADQTLRECLNRAFRRWTFKPIGATADVVIPLQFYGVDSE